MVVDYPKMPAEEAELKNAEVTTAISSVDKSSPVRPLTSDEEVSEPGPSGYRPPDDFKQPVASEELSSSESDDDTLVMENGKDTSQPGPSSEPTAMKECVHDSGISEDTAANSSPSQTSGSPQNGDKPEPVNGAAAAVGMEASGVDRMKQAWNQMRLSENDDDENPENDQIKCRVCDEQSAGFHFGAYTCEGCKSFFCRNHRKDNLAGVCSKGGGCEVRGTSNRAICKACRMNKCIAVGMSPANSRFGRRPAWMKAGQVNPSPPTSSLKAKTERSGGSRRWRPNMVASPSGSEGSDRMALQNYRVPPAPHSSLASGISVVVRNDPDPWNRMARPDMHPPGGHEERWRRAGPSYVRSNTPMMQIRGGYLPQSLLLGSSSVLSQHHVVMPHESEALHRVQQLLHTSAQSQSHVLHGNQPHAMHAWHSVPANVQHQGAEPRMNGSYMSPHHASQEVPGRRSVMPPPQARISPGDHRVAQQYQIHPPGAMDTERYTEAFRPQFGSPVHALSESSAMQLSQSEYHLGPTRDFNTPHVQQYFPPPDGCDIYTARSSAEIPNGCVGGARPRTRPTATVTAPESIQPPPPEQPQPLDLRVDKRDNSADEPMDLRSSFPDSKPWDLSSGSKFNNTR